MPTEDISIAVIAEHLRVSEGHLSHVFKKQTGMTVTNYLTKTRIDAAMRMLTRDHVKVYEAAAAVGYKDVTYFSATFKKLTGLSPLGSGVRGDDWGLCPKPLQGN